MNTKVLLVLGARSDIGLAVAHRFAKEGFDVQLAARNSFDLINDSEDLKIRYGILSSIHEIDILNINSYSEFVKSLPTHPSVVVSAIGLLGAQNESELDIKKTIEILRTNFEGVAVMLGLFANHFKDRRSGTLIGISSVAGDRGRASNYIYGSAKAGFSAFLSGLRNRLYPYGVNVITVKPGYVRTRMTSNFDLPEKLTTDPQTAAKLIYEAYKFKKEIIYISPLWKYIMKIIINIPESIFKKMKFWKFIF